MARLSLELVAQSNQLLATLDGAQKKVDQFTRAASDAGASLGGGLNRALDLFQNLAKGGGSAAGALAGAFVAVSTAAFGLAVQAGKVAEETSHLSQKIGVSADSLEGMSVLMNRVGLSSESMARGMKSLSTIVIEARSGSAEASAAFQKLGLSLDTVGQGTGDVLRAIADKFQQMPDGMEKAALATKLFGRAGLELIPILNQGSAGMDAAIKKAAEFGLILTETQRSDLTVFDDALDDLQSALKGFAMQVGVAFAPTLTALIHAMTRAVVFAKDVFNAFADAGEKLSIRLGAMVASLELIAKQLFSFSVFSKDAWKVTLDQIKAIDDWAAAQLKGVEASRSAEKGLADLAKAHLTAKQAVQEHTNDQKRLGEQIVATTKIQLEQKRQMGLRQQVRGQDIVSAARAKKAYEAQISHEIFAETFAREEAERAERYRGGPVHSVDPMERERLKAESIISTAKIEQEQMERALAELEEWDTRTNASVVAEVKGDKTREESLGHYIVANAQATQKVKGFWDTQLDSLVNSNAFSVGLIVNTWTSGIANAIVNGGKFMEQAWKATQVAIIQGAINLGIQWVALEATKVGASAAAATATTAIWAGATATITGFFATVTAAFSTMFATMVSIITAVGTYVIGVLSSIASALSATVFGIPFAGAIVLGIAAIVAAMAATGNLGFEEGGIGNFGSGTQATLHGREAVIPLDERGASFMRNVFGRGTNGPIHTHVYLDRRQIALALSDQQPSALRTMGVL